MKIQTLSDLHREFTLISDPTRHEVTAWSKMKNAQADVTVLAGDTHTKGRGIELAVRMFPDRPVIMVCGNHEFYGQVYPSHMDALKQQAAEFQNIHILENDAVEIEGVVFLGCTLWTDCQLWQKGPHVGLYTFPETQLKLQECMNDYAMITYFDGQVYRRIKPEDLIQVHSSSVLWLREQFEKYRGKKVVVVTHHAPSFRSIPANYTRDIVSAAFASHLDELVETSGATCWIHGHNHGPSDYRLGKTRVLANPKGYPGEPTRFKPGLIVKV